MTGFCERRPSLKMNVGVCVSGTDVLLIVPAVLFPQSFRDANVLTICSSRQTLEDRQKGAPFP